MKVKAPAKVNLTLYITGKDKKDGYHYIASVFDPVALSDTLEFISTKTGKITVKDITGVLAIPMEKNIVYKAAKLLKDKYGIKKGVDIKLYKKIPDGAGLGGGSSDAAATLVGLNKFWKIGLNEKQLEKLAAKIGSDVPFFIKGKPAFVSGKGEKIKELQRNVKLYYVLVYAPFKVSTKEAYALWDKEKGIKLTMDKAYIKISIDMLAGKVNSARKQFLYNDFEKVIFRKHTSLRKTQLLISAQEGCAGAGMSGSGCTIFGVFTSRAQAEKCFENICKKVRGKTFLTNSV
ncbi:MAG: 4-(cytidine 5'-diphospho)-2-C-methyl-D-erythritol kinase [bacterium]